MIGLEMQPNVRSPAYSAVVNPYKRVSQTPNRMGAGDNHFSGNLFIQILDFKMSLIIEGPKVISCIL